MRCTELTLMPVSLAIAAAVQCVLSPGGSSNVRETTRASTAAPSETGLSVIKCDVSVDALGQRRELDFELRAFRLSAHIQPPGPCRPNGAGSRPCETSVERDGLAAEWFHDIVKSVGDARLPRAS